MRLFLIPWAPLIYLVGSFIIDLATHNLLSSQFSLFIQINTIWFHSLAFTAFLLTLILLILEKRWRPSIYGALNFIFAILVWRSMVVGINSIGPI